MKRTFHNDQTGMVAIIVTMIMMFVITLIVLGFADVTRRNQREALDSQLGIQAYYAAETGVNDVVSALKANLTLPSLTNCATTFTGANGVTLPRQLKTDNGVATVANTCLLVDTTPAALIADSVQPTTDNVVWDVKEAAGDPFKTLTFGWKPDGANAGSCNSALGTYPVASDQVACNLALLRVDILPAGTATDAATLANTTATLYLQPSGAQPALSIGAFGNGAPTAYQGSCNPNDCKVTINLTGAARNKEYYVRITSLYRTARNITLTGRTDSGAAEFADGQVVIDSTGRAQDQLKRIKVRVPLGQTQTGDPVFGVQSTGTICKDILFNDPNATYDQGECSGIWPN